MTSSCTMPFETATYSRRRALHELVVVVEVANLVRRLHRRRLRVVQLGLDRLIELAENRLGPFGERVDALVRDIHFDPRPQVLTDADTAEDDNEDQGSAENGSNSPVH